jgi:hypothetical protein
LLLQGQIELWADVSHAINGEYPDEIAQRAPLLGRASPEISRPVGNRRILS